MTSMFVNRYLRYWGKNPKFCRIWDSSLRSRALSGIVETTVMRKSHGWHIIRDPHLTLHLHAVRCFRFRGAVNVKVCFLFSMSFSTAGGAGKKTTSVEKNLIDILTPPFANRQAKVDHTVKQPNTNWSLFYLEIHHQFFLAHDEYFHEQMKTSSK